MSPKNGALSLAVASPEASTVQYPTPLGFSAIHSLLAAAAGVAGSRTVATTSSTKATTDKRRRGEYIKRLRREGTRWLSEGKRPGRRGFRCSQASPSVPLL